MEVTQPTNPTDAELRDAHAALSRAIRFKPGGSAVAIALVQIRHGIDELAEWRELFGSLDEWKKKDEEKKAGDPGTPATAGQAA
jgi:hypothetical protein